VTGRYPDLLYAPIEVKGDAEVHALSRCQMILVDAKARAIAEFERALAGRTREEMRHRLAAKPRLRKATGYIAHRDWVGTAANLIANLA
jgi:hypothetical protein